MQAIPNKSRHFLPWTLEVKPTGLPPQDPHTQMFLCFIVVLLCN